MAVQERVKVTLAQPVREQLEWWAARAGLAPATLAGQLVTSRVNDYLRDEDNARDWARRDLGAPAGRLSLLEALHAQLAEVLADARVACRDYGRAVGSAAPEARDALVELADRLYLLGQQLDERPSLAELVVAEGSPSPTLSRLQAAAAGALERAERPRT